MVNFRSYTFENLIKLLHTNSILCYNKNVRENICWGAGVKECPDMTNKTDSMDPGDEIEKNVDNGAMYLKVCGTVFYQ